MWKRFAVRIMLLVGVLPWSHCINAQHTTPPPSNETLDQGTVQMLSNILESLDTFRNDRLRDLEKIRISTADGNSTTVTRLDDLSQMPENSSVSEHIKALKEGIMGHNPVKKTFGYKVTVYTSPIGQNGKDAKPVLVTQYVGGDMRPTRRADEPEDLQESANQPDRQLVHSSESAFLPIKLSSVLASAGVDKGQESSVDKGAKDHSRNTEHSESSEKGHQNGHSLRTHLAKGHDHERHSDKHDEHTKETDKESHRHDEQAHDKGGASQQGIRERTEIEYYEREHFLDTEYDKAKSGHDKSHGVKEHESHSDHDDHEDKRVHSKDDAHNHKGAQEAAQGQAIAGGHYVPPLQVDHPHVIHKDHLLHDSSVKEDSGHSKLLHSEESKGHKGHNSERDHQSDEKDVGHLEKDKGRRKEGYRERGYKITAEREYFLNDAHHDKGTASHTSGHKLKDQEGSAHGAKEGERDRGFVKEEKEEEAHDAAYDAKDKRYYDGEGHSEGFESQKKATSASGGEKKEEVIPLAPPIVNYVEPDRHPSHLYPLPIVYAPSNDAAQPVLAYPPADLPPPKSTNVHLPPAAYSQTRNREYEDIPRKQQPLGGYDDDDDVNLQSTGYRGHASYKKRTPSPLVISIRDNVRKDVHSKPPTYAKIETENSVPSDENSVRFPHDSSEENRESQKGSSSEVEESDFHREEPSRAYTESPKFEQERRRPESKEMYFHKETRSHPDLANSKEQYHPQKDSGDSHEHFQPQKDLVRSHEQYKQQTDLVRSHEQYKPQTDLVRSHEQYKPQKELVRSHEQYKPQKDLVRSHEQYRPHKDVVKFEQERRRPDTKEVYFQKETLSHADLTNPSEQYRLIPPTKNVVYLEELKRKPAPHGEHGLHGHRPVGGEQNSRLLYVQGAQNADKLIRTVDRSVYPHQQGDTRPATVSELIQEIVRSPQSQDSVRYPQRKTNDELTYADLHKIYNAKPERNQQGYRPSSTTQQQTPQSNQQQLIAKYNHLIQKAQQQPNFDDQRSDLLHLQQQQNPRTILSSLEQLQQQTKPPFSPVVLLSRGPSSQKQNQAVDVWYTRPRS